MGSTVEHILDAVPALSIWLRRVFWVLGGYIATTPKAAAEVALYAADHDPLLATWQYGLGEAAVWTSDTTGRWTASLLASPVGGRLLANVVAVTLPLQQDPRLQLSATAQGTSAQLNLLATSLPQGATVQADVVAPDGTATTADMVAAPSASPIDASRANLRRASP